MRKGEPKLPIERLKKLAEKRRESILEKCHPAIFELAGLLKETIEAQNSLRSNSPRELEDEIEAKAHKRLEEIRRKYSGPVQPAPNTFAAQMIHSDAALKSESDALGVAEWIHWERHKIPAKIDLKKRQAGDWDASRRILRTARDLEQLRCGRGPLQRPKGNLEHSNVFEVLWGLGIEKLTPLELTDFFEAHCPCESEEHDPDALKKQRNRFQNALQSCQPRVNCVRRTQRNVTQSRSHR